jgi:D-arabinose 1-dehydrogenase-like Zn-dependent alcohol dehydrogenase
MARDLFCISSGKRMLGMKALVYLGPDKKALQERPKPTIGAATDAIVRINRTTICGTDLISSRETCQVVSPAASWAMRV